MLEIYTRLFFTVIHILHSYGLHNEGYAFGISFCLYDWYASIVVGGVCMNKRRYRVFLFIALIINLAVLGMVYYFTIAKKLPSELKLLVNREESFDFQLPVDGEVSGGDMAVLEINGSNIPDGALNISFNDPFTLAAQEVGNYSIALKLFGLFTVKQIDLSVIESVELIPGGAPVGIILQTDGILVLGTGKVTGADGKTYEPALDILQTGDYIVAINGMKIAEKEVLVEELQKIGESDVNITVRRNGEEVDVTVTPVLTSDQNYKIGTWIRDDTQGIGTLTYLSTTGDYGALGHGITDVDTGIVMEVKSGNIYSSEIVSITKGVPGTPGEMSGIIRRDNDSTLGDVKQNSNQGIFGRLLKDVSDVCSRLELPINEPVEIALRQEVEVGEAYILANVDGDVRRYSIEIESVDLSNANHSKGMVIQITDEELLNQTGGIVQGMSGSPLIQNGKLIGAVTHVFIKDSTRGYATFIENMLERMLSLQ